MLCCGRFFLPIAVLSYIVCVVPISMQQSNIGQHNNFLLNTLHLLEKYFNSTWIVEEFKMLKQPIIQSFLSTAIISLVPFFLLGLIPKNSCHGDSRLMRILLGFAVGSLLGDTLLHLIPHSIESYNNREKDHHHHDNNDYSKIFINISYPLLGGLLTFYVIESIIRIIKNDSHKKMIAHQKKTDSEPKPTPEKIVLSKKNTTKLINNNPSRSENISGSSKLEQSNNTTTATNSISFKKKKSKNKSHSCGHMSSGAILNLISDFIHNLLDGMAIGVAYYKDVKLGIATTISVFLHEIPHEISDFTILIKCGYSKWKAAIIQLITATGALMGTYIGVYISQYGINGEYPYWILPFTAGGFIYVACVCVIPEMLNDQHPNLFRLILEIIGIICGLSLMEIFNNTHIH